MIPIKFGNNKIPTDTMIFNLCSAKDCPSRALGLCPVFNGQYNLKKTPNSESQCYARKAEIQYKEHVENFRKKQEEYWTGRPAEEILQDMRDICNKKREPVRNFRFNESGDFKTQADIDKMSEIAKGLKETNNITTYGFSARKDLSFEGKDFLLKGSGWQAPNGQSIIINRDDAVPEGFVECPGTGCGITCRICVEPTVKNIAFRKH